jgi:hypothetical protein
MPRDRIDFARQSFVANLRIAERNFTQVRLYAHQLHDFKHGRTNVGPIGTTLMWIPYLLAKRTIIPLLREARWRVRFYRKIEADLERGDLTSVIEALSLFAPREETTLETVRRVRTQPATIWAIQRSPHIVRVNMLRLRDDLIKIQQERVC